MASWQSDSGVPNFPEAIDPAFYPQPLIFQEFPQAHIHQAGCFLYNRKINCAETYDLVLVSAV